MLLPCIIVVLVSGVIMVMGNFKFSLEKRIHVSACVSLSFHVYVMAAVVDGVGVLERSRVGAKLKIHNTHSGDEVKCPQSI